MYKIKMHVFKQFMTIFKTSIDQVAIVDFDALLPLRIYLERD